MVTAAVALAAGLGAVCRFLVSGRWPGARGTLLVNVSGSFVLGLLVGWETHHVVAPELALIAGAGFAGGFTTLSTWAWESLELAMAGRWRAAAGNVAGSFSLGLLAAAAGLVLASLG